MSNQGSRRVKTKLILNPDGGLTEELVYTVDKNWIEEARVTAKERRDWHTKYGRTGGHWPSKNEGQYVDEYWGSLAQIGFREGYTRDAWIYDICTFSLLFTPDVSDPKMRPHWDVLIHNDTRPATVDIKGVSPHEYKRLCLIKQREFHRNDFYVAIKFLSSPGAETWDGKDWGGGSIPDAFKICGYATGDEVAASYLDTSQPYTPAYRFPLNQMPHLLTPGWWRRAERKA